MIPRFAAVLTAVGLTVALPSIAGSYHSDRNPIVRAQMVLDGLETDVGSVRSPELRERMQRRIDRLELILQRIDANAGHAVTPRYGYLSFDDAVRLVQREQFESDKARAIERVATSGRFTTQQARQLTSMMYYESGKVDALIALYPAVTDKHRFALALDVLYYSSSRRRVQTTLGI